MDRRFNVSVEGARQGGVGGFPQRALDDAVGRLGRAQQSVQVHGGLSF